jgi:hypothetical protein
VSQCGCFTYKLTWAEIVKLSQSAKCSASIMAASATGHGHTWVGLLTKPFSGSEVFAMRGNEIITASTACIRDIARESVSRQRPALMAVIIAQVVVTQVAPRLPLPITLSA